MSKIFTFLINIAFLILVNSIEAQDTLIKTNLKILVGTVQEKNLDYVVFSHLLNGENIKEMINSKDILQIIYVNGEADFYKNKIKISKQIEIKNTSSDYKGSDYKVNLTLGHNYTFYTITGNQFNATLLKNNNYNYLFSEEFGELSKISKSEVLSIKNFNDTLNYTKILPILDEQFLYANKIYSKKEINSVLLNKSNYEVLKITRKALKKEKLGRNLLKIGILPAGITALSISTYVVSGMLALDLIDEELLPKIILSGIALTAPLVIIGSKNIKESKQQKIKAIKIHNANF